MEIRCTILLLLLYPTFFQAISMHYLLVKLQLTILTLERTYQLLIESRPSVSMLPGPLDGTATCQR